MYGKIFDSMYQGTLYGQWEAIVTFQQMIVLCDADGMIDMTPPAISARTSIPLDIIKAGIKILEAPDPYSRTPDQEGRRIELIDAHRPWGWHIVNHEKYMKMQDADSVRAMTRERVKKHRLAKSAVTGGNADVTDGNGSLRHIDTDIDIDKDTDKKKDKGAGKPAVSAKNRKSSLPSDFGSAWSQSMRLWLPANCKNADELQAHLTHFVGYVKANGKQYADWEQAFQNAIRDDWAKVSAPAGKNGAPAWWTSDAGIEAKAREVGITPQRGETWQQLKGRVQQSLGGSA